MNKNVISRVILSVLLIIFMYAAAACSVSENKSKESNIKKNEETEIDTVNASKRAFADEGMAFIRAAEEAYIVSQLEDDEEKECFSLKDLIEEYVYAKEPEKYTGVVKKDKDGKWKVYITDGKYAIDGKSNPTLNDVLDGNKISINKCN